MTTTTKAPTWRETLFSLPELEAAAVARRAGQIYRAEGCSMEDAFTRALEERSGR